ncbi:MAG: right-handed parallel beta-helix repeat-containing protein [Polyangiaceae bacterium]
MRTIFSSRVVPFFFGLAFSCAACDGSKGNPAAVCPEGNEIRASCAGVPVEPVCPEEACASAVDCSDTLSVKDDASLASAISGAAPGACVVLAPGSYGAVALPAGVSLLGRSADLVTVEGVTVGGGASVVRGLTAGSAGIAVESATGARIEAVRVTGASGRGIDIAAGASLTIVDTTVEAGATDGIVIADGATVTIERTLIEDNAGPGLWVACSTDCDCADKPDVVVRSSIIRDNHVGGVVLFGAKADLEAVDVSGTLVGDDIAFGLGGGGISAAACSSLGARDLQVFENESYGLLIDASDALVGDPTGEPSVEIAQNTVGVWAQHISEPGPQTVTLDGLEIRDNKGVGLGVSGETVGLIVCRSSVHDTTGAGLLVEGGASQQVGDGLLWLDGSEITIDGLALSGNPRSSILIDGEAQGSLTNITLEGGDEEKGILQQGYSGGAQPTIGANSPAISVTSDSPLQIPVPPAGVPRNL